MRILAIETSCDETAVAVLHCSGDEKHATFSIEGNGLLSQVDIHRPYGGVYPMLAKREHARTLVPVLHTALEKAGLLTPGVSTTDTQELTSILEREPELATQLVTFLGEHARPPIDAIAVTHGPGLEPALWVGVNFARALSQAWDIPVVGINHMEGHLLSALAQPGEDAMSFSISNIELPLLGLLISGGHTEFVSMNPWLSYQLIGRTRDDAVGEAYDKVARMLGLPYPGGPEVSKLAEIDRARGPKHLYTLPRPMLKDAHCDFSFSGLKTAVRYAIGDATLTREEQEDMAREFEDAVAEVIYAKTLRAIEETEARTFAIGGGVAANTNIRRMFSERLPVDHPEISLSIPLPAFTTDNAVMIGIAGYFHARIHDFHDAQTLRAQGTLELFSAHA